MPILTICLLGDAVEGHTSVEGCHDAVGSLLGSSLVGTTYANLTELDGVGQGSLGDEANDVLRVVLCVEVGTLLLANTHGIELGCDVRGQSCATNGECVVANGAAALADDIGEVGVVCQHLGSYVLHLLVDLVAVGLAGGDGNVDVLDVASRIVKTEHFLQLVVLGVEFLVVGLHVFILDAGVGESGQKDILLVVATLVAVLQADGVADERLAQEALELVGKSLLTDVLLDELPIVVDLGVVSHCLGGLTSLTFHRIVLGKELVELFDVESTCLLVTERGLCEQGALTVLDDVLHLCIGHGKAKFVCLVLDQRVLDIGLPHLVAHLLHLLFGQVVVSG